MSKVRGSWGFEKALSTKPLTVSLSVIILLPAKVTPCLVVMHQSWALPHYLSAPFLSSAGYHSQNF